MPKSPLIPPTPTEEAYRVDGDQGEAFTRDEPFALFEDWFALAATKEPNDPNAMALATAGADGAADVRMVLLKDVGPDGLAFHTHRDSAKGAQIAANPRAALLFHWKTIRRQVRWRGVLTEVAAAESDAYFATRARGARIGAWISMQSQTLESREGLEAAMAEGEERFAGRNVPRPEHWTGYRLLPFAVEFWVNRPFRLHDRLLFERKEAAAAWTQRRLYP